MSATQHLLPIGLFDQCCPYEDRFGRPYLFHIPSLIEAVRLHEGKCRRVAFPVSREILFQGISYGSVIYEVLDDITIDRLLDPILICQFGPQEYFTVDGRHRCCRAVQLGQSSVRAYVIPEAVWRHSLCTPEEMAALIGFKVGGFWSDPVRFARLKRHLTEVRRRHFAKQGKTYYAGEPITAPVKIWLMGDDDIEEVEVPPNYDPEVHRI